jgi:hypothetical protein
VGVCVNVAGDRELPEKVNPSLPLATVEAWLVLILEGTGVVNSSSLSKA